MILGRFFLLRNWWNTLVLRKQYCRMGISENHQDRANCVSPVNEDSDWCLPVFAGRVEREFNKGTMVPANAFVL